MNESLLALALGAGLLAAVNPCGFALLPAYMSLLVLGANPEERRPGSAVLRAIRLSVAMTLGFAGVFAVFGLAIAPVASGIQQHLPWATISLGILLALAGLLVLSGRQLKVPRISFGRKPRPMTGSVGSMALFGAGYAVASLTCTIAPFLAVVVAGFRTDSVFVGITLFLAYAAGMGLVVVTVAVATALAGDSLIARMRRSGRWVTRLSGLLLLLAGSYVAYYGWWEIRVLDGAEASDPIVDRAISLQHNAANLVQSIGSTGWLVAGSALVVLAAVLARLQSRKGPPVDARKGE